ncbi:hypothetical protein AUK18_01890 [Candidatus Beckwithbacteria bacterium CG2_30_44_31]|uniref:50S ribosomal protein L29 n=1 Tax=Candidatus Beckwithbacteria bacterium CG2_30_44_31 TaxID=1805035 RepID=A0A1J5B839_9BACT|nr:MAG: hypothetical protein AUK18_01890 [Candidatus Beckwithbacteria bacterium CG2_30_44_31]
MKSTTDKLTLPQLQAKLVKLKLDLKVNKLKDTSQLKKTRYQITLLKSQPKADQPMAEKSL